MKVFINLTLVSAALMNTPLFAHEWIETPLWKAPQATSFEIKLNGKEKLHKECELYKSVVFNSDGTVSRIAQDKNRLERFRKLILPVTLELDVKPWVRIEQTVVVKDEGINEDKLPYFTQNEAITGILLEDTFQVKSMAGENSYSSISKNLGLDVSIVKFSQNSEGRFVLDLDHRDVACDLFEGTGIIELKTPAYVILKDEAAEKIQSFYNKKVLPEVKDLILANREPLSKKAVRIGYRTGRILEEEFPTASQKESEKQLLNLVTTLFNPRTLEVTSQVIKGERDAFINFDVGAEGKAVSVILGF